MRIDPCPRHPLGPLSRVAAAVHQTRTVDPIMNWCNRNQTKGGRLDGMWLTYGPQTPPMSYSDKSRVCLFTPTLTPALHVDTTPAFDPSFAPAVRPHCIVRHDVDRSIIRDLYVGLPPAIHRIDRRPDQSSAMEETAPYTR